MSALHVYDPDDAEHGHCTCPSQPYTDDPYYQCAYCEKQQLTRLRECRRCGADVDTSFRSQCDECGSAVE